MNICVIGGGASGLMAAYIASKNGHKVTLLERMPRVGKKILATGGGKCNLSNIDMDLSHFHCKDISFVESILKEASSDEVLSIFGDMGLMTTTRNGGIYPYNEQASSVVDVLRFAVSKLNVTVLTDCFVKLVQKKKDIFEIITDGDRFLADRVILCAGSKASPKSGSDGSGYDIARALGHNIVEPLPALCAIRCEGDYFKTLSGIRCKGSISIFYDKKMVARDKGELQLTNYGVSGIPAMQVSYMVSKGLFEKKKVRAFLSFLPDYDKDSVKAIIIKRIMANGEYPAEDLFVGLFHKNISLLLLKKCKINLNKSCNMLSGGEISSLAELISAFEINIIGTNSYEEAQVCQGGVDINEIKNTLESKIVKGLYFAGELIDVNGDCGGYNLQWAWSSGVVAGNLG